IEHNWLSKYGDVGIFWNSTPTSPTPGLVLVSQNPANGGKNGLRIDWDGSVVIGDHYTVNTPSTTPYKLAVAGNIIAELVRVKLRNDWPDYVFEKHYTMMTLPELEKYINTNGHLPDVPTASEIEDDGLDLGEMNRILLQKIEELTLYVIELEKRMESSNE
ncbi:MAG: hypothetical protein KDC83_04865, partial [Flavobacteriales bacterium]|nr:hypothetical protein [Flavobacteriales bacterium]